MLRLPPSPETATQWGWDFKGERVSVGTKQFPVPLFLVSGKRISPARDAHTVLVALHEWGTHSGCFANLFPGLSSKVKSFYSFDLEGHGRSAGERGGLEDFEDSVTHLGQILELISTEARAENRTARIQILGHGVGALIALRYALFDRTIPIDGLILMAPAITWADSLPRAGRPARLGRGPSPFTTQASSEDLLNHDHWSQQSFREVNTSMIDTARNLGLLKTPCLVLLPQQDEVFDSAAAKTTFEGLALRDRKCVVLKGGGHNFGVEPPGSGNQLGPPQLIQEVNAWIEAHPG